MRDPAGLPTTIGRLAMLAGATLIVSVAALLWGPRWLVPILDAVPAWIFMVAALRRGSRAGAIGLMLWWALWLALAGVAFTMIQPQRAGETILNGAAYRDEMLAWISTGTGPESAPSLFIPQHLLHAGVFCALALLTGGAASLAMGAALMNYMSFYVGGMVLRCASSQGDAGVALLAWNPWSMVRVVSFVILGVVLAEPLLSRMRGAWPEPAGRARWLAIAIVGLALDILLKTMLSPLWPAMLRPCLG